MRGPLHVARSTEKGNAKASERGTSNSIGTTLFVYNPLVSGAAQVHVQYIMNITFVPSEEVSQGFIQYHHFGTKQEPGSIALNAIIKNNIVKIADNILLLKVMTDKTFPEFTLPVEINVNYPIEYNSNDIDEINILKSKIALL